MFAIIKTGGKQYTVETGRTLKVETVKGKKGAVFTYPPKHKIDGGFAVRLIKND